MAIIFQSLNLGLLGTVQTPQQTLSAETTTLTVRAQKVLWPIGGAIAIWQEYSLDGGTTWIYGGGATGDYTGSQCYTTSYYDANPLPAGTLVRGNLTTTLLMVSNFTLEAS